ncbi:ATP-binding cassette, subfamily C (CFTR/MRP), member 4 [Fistulifera solaris]|uniref:ATP-binding cassette, subfamily C (CFTR/MRP), member 4 n=1 Tax=Fistulifera solaris TaxID=1519565 RepID=A0A1Z5JYH6_FISSO|nr:ATP-binding cassette, subfamily C (CFTR/MRP), member 4 [Fistulifera solaris]|eukprot:GAX19080.1 ATP-binding cassette, subfamily C (CFTR/MRP), member 4 [Fistulifera solaris]
MCPNPPESSLDAVPSKDECDVSAPSISNKNEECEAAALNNICDKEKTGRSPNPLQSASFGSKLFFSWPYPLLQLGMKRPLEDADLSDIMRVDSSAYNGAYFQRMWQRERETSTTSSKKARLHHAFFWDFLRTLWYVQPFMALGCAARVVQAVALGFFIDSLDNNNNRDNDTQVIGYAALILACGCIVLMEHHHVFFWNWRRGMQYRLSAVAAIYEKSLRLPSLSSSESKVSILNLASNDVDRFLLASLFAGHLFWAPLQSLAILATGVALMGVAFLAGFVLLLVVFVPLQFYLSRRFASLRQHIAGFTDQRVHQVKNALKGIRVIKWQAMEYVWQKRIQTTRAQEMEKIIHANHLKAWNEALFFVTNIVVAMTIFFVHVIVLGKTLEPGHVFTVYSLMNILQLEMTKHVSLGVMGVSELSVSLTRLQAFFELPEWSSSAQAVSNREKDDDSQVGNGNSDNKVNNTTSQTSLVMSLRNVTCHWNHNFSIDLAAGDPVVALHNITLDFSADSLTVILGAVGAGKSALLQCLIQELPVASGSFRRQQRHDLTMAYAAQDPWMMDGTVRDNVCMGLPYDQEFYEEVMTACALQEDLRQWPKGDYTWVGDRGVQCSGGQRARISLARALYRRAQLLILDDPLAAVDAATGFHLFQNAILKVARQHSVCVVLATHQHQHLMTTPSSSNSMDYCRCVWMQQGTIECIGTYDDCIAKAYGTEIETKAVIFEAKQIIELKVVDNDNDLLSKSLDDGDEDEIADHHSSAEEDDTTKEREGDEDDMKEANVQGLVRLDTYTRYIKAMGGLWVGAFLFILFSITQGSVLVTVATFGRWAESDDQDSWDIVGLALGLTGAVVALGIFRAFLSLSLTVKASQRLHDQMTESVLRAQISFFDTNPLGRILNRFSADVGSNDDMLPPTLFDFSVVLFIVLGALATTVTTLPFTLIAIPPLLWYFWWVRRIFVTSTRELKRLEGLARSPLFAMLNESASGIATLRSNHGAVEFFRRKFQEAHDGHTRAFFAFIAASRWLGFRMDAILFLFLCIVTILSVVCFLTGFLSIDPLILGLTLSLLLQLAGLFQWCIRQSAEVENQMVSVERVLAFGQLQSEAPLEQGKDAELLRQGWPSAGSLEYNNVTVRYRPSLPPALQAVSFKVPAGARVGIVGRTGAGKSSLVQSLFRLLEAEDGQILIDGVDIQPLGLHALRKRVSVIPQAPTLFSGCSVRENVDTEGTCSETELIQVMETCHLSHTISKLPNGLDSLVEENGANFSVGQRQLLCLARALLKRNPILVLDEATASVDRKTDQYIQEALKKLYKGTVLAVAHRLDTVIECDLILVLGQGRVLEFGTPAELLDKTDGVFTQMVQDTGDRMAQELRARALRRRG